MFLLTTRSCCFQCRQLQIRSISHKHDWLQPKGINTGVQIYNCIAKKKVPLVLPADKFATWYTCGPTVYDSCHLGHASCYVKLDIIQRILRKHLKINLVTAMNITDIDDKIISRSTETGKDWREISSKYESQFWLDMNKLNVTTPNIKLRVTENIPKIIAFIEDILAKGLAYKAKDNSIYFDVKKFGNYGKLQKINTSPDSLQNQLAIKNCEADFALWKCKKHKNEPSWESPWGQGRPGWHIECSSLASATLGSKLDFHAGGLDLRFPHHENEEAQSCAYHNTHQWVNYWVHAGQLHVKGDEHKMSKSLKNTIHVSDMLSKYEPDVFRMACLFSNYRHTMEYSDELMMTAANTFRKFKTFKADCQAYLNGAKHVQNVDSNAILQNLNYAMKEVNTALLDDFNTAHTVNIILDQVSSISRCINNPISDNLVQASSGIDVICAVGNFVENVLGMYGFDYFSDNQKSNHSFNKEIDIEKLLVDILNSRATIRQRAITEKNPTLFEVCDELRQSFLRHGVEVRDHNNGSSWTFVDKKQNNN